MFARGVHDYIQRSPEVPLYKALCDVSLSGSLKLALIVSPIVFFAVYKATHSLPDTIVSLLLAFQNGFFWKTILEKSATT